MPLKLAALSVTQPRWTASAVPGEGQVPAPLRAAAGRSAIRDETNRVTLPPAGDARAETVFTTVGLILVLAIVLSAAWILLRRRL